MMVMHFKAFYESNVLYKYLVVDLELITTIISQFHILSATIYLESIFQHCYHHEIRILRPFPGHCRHSIGCRSMR